MLRVKIAGKFGRIEHTMGELLGLVLWGEYLYFRVELLLPPAIIWTVYIISHRLEKRFYGRYGSRG